MIFRKYSRAGTINILCPSNLIDRSNNYNKPRYMDYNLLNIVKNHIIKLRTVFRGDIINISEHYMKYIYTGDDIIPLIPTKSYDDDDDDDDDDNIYGYIPTQFQVISEFPIRFWKDINNTTINNKIVNFNIDIVRDQIKENNVVKTKKWV
jgi:hypothetical protein